MSTITKRLSVDQYEAMIENGILPESPPFELIEGRLVAKMAPSPPHSVVTGWCLDALDALLPEDWHTRQEQPVSIPRRRSEPEPDVAVVRGVRGDYLERHPGPEDLALVVEVTRTSARKDRARARVYGKAGIPAYWIVNVKGRQLEVYAHPTEGAYPAPTILGETESVELVIEGQVVGRIAVADLLPRAKGGAK
jgi:Uma2 family endonuclease